MREADFGKVGDTLDYYERNAEQFAKGTNWKDFAPDMSYEDYRNMTDRQHLNKAKTMPIRFLKASGKGFFVDKEGYALAIGRICGCCGK